jgi:hypothetical protein
MRRERSAAAAGAITAGVASPPRHIDNRPMPKAPARPDRATPAGLARTRPLERPLRAAPATELAARFQAAIAAADGVTGAHCIHEWWMRDELPGNIERALAQLWQHAAASIPEWLPMRYVDWLPVAYAVAARFRPVTRGRANLYLVLLDYGDRGGEPHGAYVGMSRYSPAERFDQHKAGIRAAGSVLKRGLEVLTGPTLHLQRIGRAEAAVIEEGLAAALRAEGLAVEGGH